MRIAIHPDDYTDSKRPALSDASSPRWAEEAQVEDFLRRLEARNAATEA